MPIVSRTMLSGVTRPVRCGLMLAGAVFATPAILSVAAAPALAGTATDWQQANHAATRLLVDKAKRDDREVPIVAGIHVKLDDGWKTYWRNPGDAGLPPSFDWSGSRNLKSAKVLWPAPVRFKDSAGTSYGYKKEVVFPVLVEAQDPAKPVELHLRLEYAVCADICIPAEAELSVSSKPSGFFSRSYSGLLEAYLAKVPVKLDPGKGKAIGVQSATAKLSGDNPELVFEAKFPAETSSRDLFVEGPEGFYLPPSKVAADEGNGRVRYRIDLTKGDDPKELAGKSVIVTLVSDKAQAEVRWQVK